MLPTFSETWTRDFYKNKRGIKKEKKNVCVKRIYQWRSCKRQSCPLRSQLQQKKEKSVQTHLGLKQQTTPQLTQREEGQQQQQKEEVTALLSTCNLNVFGCTLYWCECVNKNTSEGFNGLSLWTHSPPLHKDVRDDPEKKRLWGEKFKCDKTLKRKREGERTAAIKNTNHTCTNDKKKSRR